MKYSFKISLSNGLAASHRSFLLRLITFTKSTVFAEAVLAFLPKNPISPK
jgi:hypothetical protein